MNSCKAWDAKRIEMRFKPKYFLVVYFGSVYTESWEVYVKWNGKQALLVS